MQIENFTLKLSTLYSLLFILLKLTIKNLYFISIFFIKNIAGFRLCEYFNHKYSLSKQNAKLQKKYRRKSRKEDNGADKRRKEMN